MKWYVIIIISNCFSYHLHTNVRHKLCNFHQRVAKLENEHIPKIVDISLNGMVVSKEKLNLFLCTKNELFEKRQK